MAEQAREPRWHMAVSLIVVLCGLLITVGLTLHVRHDAQTFVAERFTHHAMERVALIDERLQARQQELDSVRRLFANSELVTPREFASFTMPLLEHHLALYSTRRLDIDPLRANEQLDDFARRASQLLGRRVALQRLLPSGEYQPLEAGDRHFLLLLENTRCNSLPPGLDLSAPGPLRQSLDAALYSEQVNSASTLQVECAGESLQSLILVTPTFGLSPGRIDGALFSLLDLEELVSGGNPLQGDNADLSLAVLPIEGNGQALYFGPEPVSDQQLIITRPLGQHGTAFRLTLMPTRQFSERNPLPSPWLSLLPGGLVSLLLGGLLYTMLHQRHHAFVQVARRTHQLEESRKLLHQAEERWNLALDSAGDGVWDWNLELGLLYLSPKWKQILGYGDEQIGDSPDEWRNRVHPEDHHANRHALRDHLRQKSRAYISEHRLRCGDGSWKWVIARGRVVQRDAEGHAQRMIGTLADISHRKRLELQVREANSRMQALLEAATQVAIIAITDNGRVETFNRGAEQLLGYQHDEILGKPANVLFDGTVEDLKLHFDQLLSGKQNCALETRLRTLMQQQLPVTLMLSRIRDDGYLMIAIDISARLQAQTALQERSELLTKLGAQVPGVIFQMRQLDGRLSISWASSGLQGLFALSVTEVERDARALFERICIEDRELALQSLQQSGLHLRRWQQDFRVVLPERAPRWIHGEATPEELEDGSLLWHGYLTEITALKQVEQELRTLTITDPLTGIYNRRHFRDQLAVELARQARGYGALALIMLDIDHFKHINDQFGHDVGDLVLKELCRRIGKLLRRADLLCRLGGEEFAILCPQTDLAHARLLAERLRRAIEEPPFERAGRVTASFGLATAIADDNGDHLLQRADRALYAAKTGGRNRVCDQSDVTQGCDAG